MAFLIRTAVAFALLGFALEAQPVASEADKPLDLALPWRYSAEDTFYLQHLCSAGQARVLRRRITEAMRDIQEKFPRGSHEVPLQFRLYANAKQYQNKLRFSPQRTGHFNERLNLITAHCGTSDLALRELLVLQVTAGGGYRYWQRLLLAEAVPRMPSPQIPLAGGKIPNQTLPLIKIIVSNHPLDRDEMLALASMARQIARAGKWEEFIAKLQLAPGADSTGLDIFESIFPGSADRLLRGENILDAGSNNTLRNRH